MRRNIISKVIILSIISLSIFVPKSYGKEDGTVRMEVIDGPEVWTNINVSESYEECRSLNSKTSTLGTEELDAHLTTDADWSAMAIFSVSQYGGATTNNPKQTNGNNSGIYDIATTQWNQSAGILDSAKSDTTGYVSGLFDENGEIKKYIKKWPITRTETKFVGFIDTWGWLSGRVTWGKWPNLPVSMKNGLFGVMLAEGDYNGDRTKGGPFTDVTFRPVLWS